MGQRRKLVLGFGLVSLVGATARAEVCPYPMKNKSCHITKPTLEVASPDAVVSPVEHYSAYFWVAGNARAEPPEATGPVTRPGIQIHLGAGGWGEASKEPMAISTLRMAHLLADGVQWMIPETSSNNYEWPCEAGTSLCLWPDSSGGPHLLDSVSTTIYRSARIVKVNPAPLPASVTHVPVKLDYRIAIVTTGEAELKTGTVDALRGSAAVYLGHWGTSIGGPRTAVDCANDKGLVCRTPESDGAWVPVNGNSTSGTMTHQAPVSLLDKLYLTLDTGFFIAETECRDRQTADGEVCASAPLRATGQAVADPYMYIDPTWMYASWFKLEISADETDTTWVTPERTPFDPVTLTVLDGGSGDAGVVDPDAGSAHADAGHENPDGGSSAADVVNPDVADAHADADTDADAGHENPADDPETGAPNLDDDDGAADAPDGSGGGREKKGGGEGGCQLGHRAHGGASWPLALSILALYQVGRRRRA